METDYIIIIIIFYYILLYIIIITLLSCVSKTYTSILNKRFQII